jgi:hypothetical protein
MRTSLVLTGTVLLLILPSAPADSCDCVRPKAPSNAVRTEFPFLFEGEVIEIVERVRGEGRQRCPRNEHLHEDDGVEKAVDLLTYLGQGTTPK